MKAGKYHRVCWQLTNGHESYYDCLNLNDAYAYFEEFQCGDYQRVSLYHSSGVLLDSWENPQLSLLPTGGLFGGLETVTG